LMASLQTPAAAYRVAREVVMFAARQRSEPANAEANRLLFELEQEFDLMRLRDRRVIVEQEETRLAEKLESLRRAVRPSENPTGGVLMARWWRAVTKRSAIWWLEIRRGARAEEARRLALLEGEIEFTLRLRERRAHA
jgi:hypothetical protein